MAGANELLIKISADAKNATKAFDDIRSKTDQLESQLNKASLAGAVVFAALAFEVKSAVGSFIEAEQASAALSQALQNQGIFTTALKEEYASYADEVQRVTGLDNDAVIKAQAVAQSFLGQTKITQELTDTIADLATKTGSLDSAAQLIGRSIGTSTNALARQGVTIREGSTEAERYTQVLEQLSIQVGGQAAAANKAGLGLQGLKSAFGDVQEEIGARFAPVIREIVARLTDLFVTLKDNKPLLDFVASLIVGAGAAAAFVAAAGPLVTGLLSIKAALIAAGVGGAALTASMFAIPAAIAAVVTGVVLLALNWDKAMIRMRAATAAFLEFSTVGFDTFLSGFNGLVSGTLSPADALKKILSSPFAAGEAASKKYNTTVLEGYEALADSAKASEEKQNVAKKEAADKKAAIDRAEEGRQLASRKAADAVKILQLEEASKEEIAIAQERASIIKNLENEKNEEVKALSQERLEQLDELAAQRNEEELAKIQEQELLKNQTRLELAELGVAEYDAVLEQQFLKEQERQQGQRDSERAVALEIYNAKVNARNLDQQDAIKHGAIMAAIGSLLRSKEVAATKTITGELVGLANSKNAELKAIGKAAAIAQITIATAESAITIANSVIRVVPFPINVPLAAGLAAARIAYGAEQISNVTAAATGALVGGTGTGDTQPFLLTPGELVSPRKNFNEVIEGVQTERSGVIDDIREGLANLQNRQGSNTTINVQGDVLAEDSYIDRLAQKFSEAVEFRNARFIASGVTA